MKIRHIILISAGLAAWPGSEARAEFWTALDTEPKPNVVIGIDSSVTMAIEPNACGGNRACHRWQPFHSATRLTALKNDLLATIPSFRNYFAFGGFRYQGCDYAHVVPSSRVLPNNQNLDASYTATENMIIGTGHCQHRESDWPGNASPTSGCITVSANCVDDYQVLDQVVNNGLNGLNVTLPANYRNDVQCDLRPPDFINLESLVVARLGTTTFTWPSWGSTPDRTSVEADLCMPLQGELTAIRNDIQTCTSTPTDVWDMSFLSGNWCDATTIASSICASGSPFYGTCVCDPTQNGCTSGSRPRSACNHPLDFEARQQIAVCETYNPNTFGNHFINHPTQVDNIARARLPVPPPGNFCRENVALFMTDGAFGDKWGVWMEAQDAVDDFYESADGISNMFVFHVSNSFFGEADAMMQRVSDGLEPNAFRASNPITMRESFSKVLSRIYKGVYTGASMTFDKLGRRAVLHSFTVPGYDRSGLVGVSDDYLGMPSRISVHEVQPTGVLSPTPLFESDWTDRVNATTSCGPVRVPQTLLSDPAVGLLGPGGRFRNNVLRNAIVSPNAADRDGDGAADSHPSLTWGRSFGLGQSTPLIVDAPKDIDDNGRDPTLGAAHLAATRTRPRVIYYQSNGYVIGIHGGIYDATAGRFGDVSYAYRYDDTVPYAGSEVFRFRPEWLNETDVRYDYPFNDVVQQPLMTGELIARELFIGNQYRTVLIGNQGKEGRGYFALDITDPCSQPSFVSQWVLPPGSYASGEPNAYTFPMMTPPLRRPVLVATSGLDATNSEIYAFDIETEAMLDSEPLPSVPGHSYPTAPVCIDVTGEGVVTHCYALRSDGYLARIAVTAAGFQSPIDATPRNGGPPITIGGGRTFFTPPVAFFDQDGAVALVFGSGDYRNLTQPSGTNYVYKVRDPASRQSGALIGPTTTAQVCLPNAGGNTEGVFQLGPGERLISEPIVEDGIVAWVTYVSRTNGCVSGEGYVYAMDFHSCYDVTANTLQYRPQRNYVGLGLPTSPTIHRQGSRLLTNTSAGPTATQIAPNALPRTRGAGRAFVKRLFWRPEVNSQ